MFLKNIDVDFENAGQGITRKILAYSGKLMSVEVHFKKGAKGDPHAHPHEQITYVLKGKFEVTVGKQKSVLSQGDMFYTDPYVSHEVTALEAGILLDTFTPQREEFRLKGKHSHG